MRIGTKVVRAGLRARAQGDPFSVPVTFAGTYRAAGDPSTSPYTYGRYHNPTWTQFETALGDLESGTAVSFASGMAAVAAVFGTSLRSKDVLVIASESYYTTRLLATGFFAEMGVDVKQAPIVSNELYEHLPGAKLLWLESPSNPSLEVCDIRALVEAAHKQNVLVALDNTTATALAQSPLELGVDFSLASDTKALTGHADLVLGHVAVRDQDLLQKLLTWRTQTGAVPGPMEVWLALRSLTTLEMRLERQCGNALKIAEYLSTRSDLTGLRYPGLTTDRSHKIARKQMRHYGSLIAFVLRDRAAAEKFLSSCKLVIEATSFGSVHTTAERRARWAGDQIPEGFIRLSVGCEDVRDLIEDLSQALDQL